MRLARQAAVLDGEGRWCRKHGAGKRMMERPSACGARKRRKTIATFPTPTLPPLVIEQALVDQVRVAIPERRAPNAARFVARWDKREDRAVLTSHPRIAAFFEEASTLHGNATKGRQTSRRARSLRDVHTQAYRRPSPLARQIAQLLKLVDSAAISGKQAKMSTRRLPERIARRAMSLPSWDTQVSDVAAIEALCRRLIEQKPQAGLSVASVEKLRLMGYFVGQVMRKQAVRQIRRCERSNASFARNVAASERRRDEGAASERRRTDKVKIRSWPQRSPDCTLPTRPRARVLINRRQRRARGDPARRCS